MNILKAKKAVDSNRILDKLSLLDLVLVDEEKLQTFFRSFEQLMLNDFIQSYNN